MRKLSYALAASLLALGVAGQAQAAELGWTGSVAVQIATLDPVVINGAGTATVNNSSGPGHLTNLAIPASPFAVTGFVVPVTDPGAFPIAGVQVTAHNGDGAFQGDGGAGFGGTMPIIGTTKVCLFGPCSAAVQNLNVPLDNVGQGGTAFVQGAVNLTVVGAPWTTGTAAVGDATAMGGVSPLSNTGAPSGTVTLVTPVFISTNIGASAVLPAFGVMTLHFVPEPGTLMLLGSGIAGLVAFGRNRARK
ncbi:MAG: hypothetical protein DCC71_16875 [Proteobacteria bacterium]|nr:MAG: hypothetical protein DCC71_16875 [Pseudomonadota bacterium]